MRLLALAVAFVGAYAVRTWRRVAEDRIVTLTIEAARELVANVDGEPEEEVEVHVDCVSGSGCRCPLCRGEWEREGDDAECRRLGYRWCSDRDAGRAVPE